MADSQGLGTPSSGRSTPGGRAVAGELELRPEDVSESLPSYEETDWTEEVASYEWANNMVSWDKSTHDEDAGNTTAMTAKNL